MAKLHADMLLVGSVNLNTAEEVFKTCGKLMGDHVPALPDGELGERSMWIYFLAAHTYHGHAAITTIGEIIPVKAFPPSGAGPQNPEAVTHFRLKEGIKTVHFDELGYAREAIKSYAVFRQRRGAGDIANGVRFQVALPFPQDATFLFFRNPAEAAIVAAAYEEALGREIGKIFDHIPAGDLAIQFDVCTDLLEVEGTFYPWSHPESAWQRYVEPLRRLPRLVPTEALLGFHFCYGTYPKKPVIQPKDLALSVRFANAAVAEAGRRVDFVHMTVPIQRSDDAYFKPLLDLKIGDTKVYLGVINSDGVEGASRRLTTARKYLPDCGVAAECGFGREKPEDIPALLKIHHEVAERLLQ